ncbi:protein male-specific lethal-3 isoform X2 [Achroia grisella]|uniref:protein male-specific lethal-3 isoform X2 n=1 Tax=Achroia grisella TaxID=688607 RepID=UPI0027D2D41C|nr:protein male-specific lethal-3 isoform X2 [Achroia grisella]
MVSTRGIRYKFSEGERVLCYEPDPTKAKVLYDSKVLEVIESKDKRGRRTVEYLIHFQGWNSSWDRCVSEDFVLKDTEENRQLQRDLAEKSQLQLGAYLYRRERKKGSSSNTGAGPAKRARHGFSDDGSSSSTQPDGETGDTDSSTGSGSSSQPHSPPTHSHIGRAHIALPSALRDRLTFDYHLVVKRGRVSALPAAPCAAQILESFVKWFARAGAWHPPHPAPHTPHTPYGQNTPHTPHTPNAPHTQQAARAKHDPPRRPDLLDVSCRLNLVREVADGLRVYFDFILRRHLLYKQELNQYHEICGQFIEEEMPRHIIKTEIEEDESNSQDDGTLASAEEDIMSPKMPEYSHLPPDPVEGEKFSEPPQTDSQEELQDSEANDKPLIKIEPMSEESQNNTWGSAKTREGRCTTRSGNVARRLRSHKSAVSQSENEEPAPSTSAGEPRTFETLSSSVGSSGSSLSESWSRPAQATPTPATPPTTRTPLSLLLDKVAKWQIIPREGTENLPCRVYGAIHLARLFVKLPDFLNATQMPDFKLKLILKHIDMFVQYLDEHSEWFGETYYIADSVSRSH